jgi:hypothetical protein
VEEPQALAEVAQAALEICHFQLSEEPGSKTGGPSAAQPATSACSATPTNGRRWSSTDTRFEIFWGSWPIAAPSCAPLGRSRQEHLEWLRQLIDPRSELERRFLETLAAGGYRLPDDAQKAIADPRCVVDFFYDPNVCIFCDGTVHDQLPQAERDRQIRAQLLGRGYRVIVLRYDQDLREQLARYPEVFGQGN